MTSQRSHQRVLILADRWSITPIPSDVWALSGTGANNSGDLTWGRQTIQRDARLSGQFPDGGGIAVNSLCSRLNDDAHWNASRRSKNLHEYQGRIHVR